MKKLILTLISSVLTLSSSFAAEINDIIKDTQKMTLDDGNTMLVWWIPSQFWDASFEQEKALTDEQRKKLVATLEDYTTFAIFHVKTGAFGAMTFKERQEILDNISLTFNDKEIKPSPIDDLTPDAEAFFNMMKPMMGQMLGQMGKGMEFIVYPNKIDGKIVIDPTKEGAVNLTAFTVNNKWRLPLGSLLPPALDPETKERFPGNYKFNPFTGSKLLKQ